MIVIKRVGVLSLGTMCGILSAIMGLIFALIWWMLFSIISFFVESYGGMYGGDYGMDGMMWLGGGMVVIIGPIFYGVIGFIGGIISGALYNLFARWVGGIKVELRQEVAVEQSTASNI